MVGVQNTFVLRTPHRIFQFSSLGPLKARNGLNKICIKLICSLLQNILDTNNLYVCFIHFSIYMPADVYCYTEPKEFKIDEDIQTTTQFGSISFSAFVNNNIEVKVPIFVFWKLLMQYFFKNSFWPCLWVNLMKLRKVW